MNITGSTILITGGGTGIGRGLAEALQKESNQVIIAGRRQAMLDATIQANPGIKSVVFDIGNTASIRAFADKLVADFPSLNVVINNAGIMSFENLHSQSDDLSASDSMVTTNLTGPIHLTAALLPHLLKQKAATVMTVTSGLAFVPLAMTPTYCATKAALHSYSQSLRYQLKDTSVDIIELIPPYVQTELTGEHQASDPRAMPLDAFITEVISILKSTPQPTEINVQNVLPLRNAEANGNYSAFFKNFNDQMAASSH